jgi:hypothetical protein
MKKVLTILVVIFALVAVAVVASPAYAQEGNPPVYPRGGHGHGGGMYADPVNMDSVLSDLIHANLADALGLTPEELTAREAAGDTFIEIALASGFSAEDAWDMQLQARLDALEQGVAQGLITQEQADWMTERWDSMPMYAYNSGSGQSYTGCWDDDTSGENPYNYNQSGRGGHFGR